jgi:hypothetical protein
LIPSSNEQDNLMRVDCCGLMLIKPPVLHFLHALAFRTATWLIHRPQSSPLQNQQLLFGKSSLGLDWSVPDWSVPHQCISVRLQRKLTINMLKINCFVLDECNF